VTDQSSSHSAAEESGGDNPAELAPDDARTEVSAPDSAAAPPEASAGSDPPAAPDSPAAPAPPAAFAPADATASSPPVTPPPPVTDSSSGESASAGPAGLAAAFPSDRPERAVGAAFAGGLVLALILKRLAR
jgi:hypothetical protein